MKASLLEKLEKTAEHYRDLGALLSDPEVLQNTARFRDLSKEYTLLDPIVQSYTSYKSMLTALEETKMLLKDTDPELRALAEEECPALQNTLVDLEKSLQYLLLPKDPNDDKNVFLEVRAGTGGHEAALFAGDLFRMYCRFAEQKKWSVEIISSHAGEQGGYKEVIAEVTGSAVFAFLKFESGVHRVQRVPSTESQGRIHTSACTVAVLPEVAQVDAIEVQPDSLRIDTFRASGAGGQHVNKTDSAIRITHLPSGLVVECQDERSQHKNKAKALALLNAKLLQRVQEKQAKEQAATRKTLVGSGDRSERIRTYNFPQGRVTDHRIGLTLYKLEEVLMGSLVQVLDPLRQELQAALLAQEGV